MRLVHLVAVSLATAPAVALSEELAAETQAVAGKSTKHEVLLLPAALKLGSGTDLTGALSAGVAYGFKVSDAFALQARFSHRTASWSTGFYEGLITSGVAVGEPFYDSVVPGWTLTAGTEFQPNVIAFDFLGTQTRGQLLLSAGVGAADAKSVVLHGTEPGEWNWFDTGIRPALHVGGGVSLLVGRHVSVRLEVTNVTMSSDVSRVNGCDRDDLISIADASRVPGGATPFVSQGCREESFTQRQAFDAAELVLWNQSGLRHDLSLALGVSAAF